HQWVVVRQADDASAKPDGACALGRGRQVHLGRRDDLPPSAVMLAHPGFIEPEMVEPLDQLHVTLECVGRVATNLVEGCHENPKLHPPRQSHTAKSSRPAGNWADGEGDDLAVLLGCHDCQTLASVDAEW